MNADLKLRLILDETAEEAYECDCCGVCRPTAENVFVEISWLGRTVRELAWSREFDGHCGGHIDEGTAFEAVIQRLAEFQVGLEGGDQVNYRGLFFAASTLPSWAFAEEVELNWQRTLGRVLDDLSNLGLIVPEYFEALTVERSVLSNLAQMLILQGLLIEVGVETEFERVR